VSNEVFINYRQADSGIYRALLYLGLVEHFGPDVVYMDSMSIPAGSDFTVELLAQVRRTRVMLAVIGPAWLTAVDAAGRRLIDDPDDWVHRELATAFAAGVRVIPVLTDGAILPLEHELPADIAMLARCQARQLRVADVTSDLARLRRDLRWAVPGMFPAADPRQARVVSIWLPCRKVVRIVAHWVVAVVVAALTVIRCQPPRRRRRPRWERRETPRIGTGPVWHRSYFRPGAPEDSTSLA
jgi:hypothetical protein